MSGASERRNRAVKIWAETQGHCVYCDETAGKEDRTVDHIWPQSKGGDNYQLNLMASCAPCNERRNTYYPPSHLAHPKWKSYVEQKEAALYRHSSFIRCMVDSMKEKNMPSIGKVRKRQRRKRHG